MPSLSRNETILCNVMTRAHLGLTIVIVNLFSNFDGANRFENESMFLSIVLVDHVGLERGVDHIAIRNKGASFLVETHGSRYDVKISYLVLLEGEILSKISDVSLEISVAICQGLLSFRKLFFNVQIIQDFHIFVGYILWKMAEIRGKSVNIL